MEVSEGSRWAWVVLVGPLVPGRFQEGEAWGAGEVAPAGEARASPGWPGWAAAGDRR